MCGNFPNIKVVEGNAFSLVLPLKRRTFESCQPIDEDIDATQLTDVVVKFGGVEYTPSLGVDGVTIILPATLARGTYDIVLTAKYQGTDIRAAYESAISIVPWNSQSDAQQFVPGSPIVCDAAYVIGGALTDAELEQLKEEYREKNAQLDQAIADAEAAKEHYDQLAEEISGVAQEQTLTQGVQDIREDISHIDIDTSTLAKETTAEAAKQAALDAKTAAQNAETAAGQAKTAAEAAQTAVSALPTLQQMIEAGMIPMSFDGLVYVQGYEPETSFGIIANKSKLVEVHDNKTLRVPVMVANDYPLLEVFEMSNATSAEYDVLQNSALKKVILPRMSGYLQNFAKGSISLIYVNIEYANFSNYNTFYGCVNLIDVVFGKEKNTNSVELNQWSPTNALSSSSQSLLTQEDIDAGFTSNLEKLLYNIREHIAANLPTDVGNKTITFTSAIKSAIQADQTTLNSFPSNWTIA